MNLFRINNFYSFYKGFFEFWTFEAKLVRF